MMPLLWEAAEALVPSFLRDTTPLSSRGRIAVLDCLRGLASLIVFNEHVTANLTANSIWGYGSDGVFFTSQLPLVRLLFCGSSAISVFFVVSGYVISYRPLEEAYVTTNPRGSVRRIISIGIRRPIRLCLPTLVAILSCALTSYLGLFDVARSNYGEDNEPYWLHEMPPPNFENLSSQMVDAVQAFYALTNLGVGVENSPPAGIPSYDGHLWTIPVELQSSILLCLILICVTQMRAKYGQATLVMCTIHAFVCDRWAVLCFMAGASLSMSDILNHKYRAGQSKSLITLIVGLLFLSAPVRECQQDLFYRWMVPAFLQHQGYDCGAFVRIPGAVLVVYSILHLQTLQSILVNRFSSYLGKVSFSIYLVHGPVIRCLFHAVIPWIYERTGDGTYDGQDDKATVIAWLIGWALCFPTTIWVADLFWRIVDQPSIRAARWVEDWLCIDEAKTK